MKYTVPKKLPRGLNERMNENGVFVLDVHYLADPAKRDPKWIAEASRGMDERDVKREFEIDWSVADGKPVFPNFQKERHVAQAILRAEPGIPVVVGWDFGLNPAAVFYQFMPSGQSRILRTLAKNNAALITFGWEVIQVMLELNAEAGLPTWDWTRLAASLQTLTPADYPTNGQMEGAMRKLADESLAGGLDFEHIGDPAGKQRSAISDGSRNHYQLLKARFGIAMKPGKQDWETRRNAVTGRLVAPDVDADTPAFLVSPHPSNDLLIAGFVGGYAYAESADTGGREVPIKDKYSHPQDGAQYPLTIKFPVSSRRPVSSAITHGLNALLGLPSPDDATKAKKTAEAKTPDVADAPDTPPSRGFPRFRTKRDATKPQAARWNPFVQSGMD